MKFYYDLISQPSRAVHIFLNINKIPYVNCAVALRKAEHLQSEFEKVNPMKKVPAIDHNGFKLAESIAIIRYVSREFPITDHWYPKASTAQAKVDEYLEWQHLNVRLGGAMYFMTKILYPSMTGEPVNKNRLANYANKLSESIDQIENVFLKRSSFIAGNEISVADIFAACELEQPYAAGYDIYAGHDKLKEWMERVKNRLQPHYDEAHKYLYKMRQTSSGKSKM